MTAFSNLNRRKDLQEVPKLKETVVKSIGDFFK